MSGNKKILVAEDEPFQKLSLIDIFSLCDFDVEAVDNGRQALEALQANPDMYDMVLLDIIMPEMVFLWFLIPDRMVLNV